MSPARFYRSTREAFPSERFPAVSGPYRRDPFAQHLGRAVLLFVLLALIGAMIGWRM